MDQHRTCDKAPSGKRGGQADRQAGFAGCGIAATWRLRVYLKVCQDVTLLHGYANPLKRLDTSESVNLHKCLILLDSCRLHATRWMVGPKALQRGHPVRYFAASRISELRTFSTFGLTSPIISSIDRIAALCSVLPTLNEKQMWTGCVARISPISFSATVSTSPISKLSLMVSSEGSSGNGRSTSNVPCMTS